MKRALAERIKQTAAATDHGSPQQPPSVSGITPSGNPSIPSSSSTAQDSTASNNYVPISKKLHNSADPTVTTPAVERSHQHSTSGNGSGNSAPSPGGSSNEPPKKIPRLERPLDTSNHLNNASPQQSPRSPRNLPKKNVMSRTNSSGTFQPPSSKRRFSGDAAAAAAAAAEQEISSSSRGTKKRIKNDSDEEEEDSNSAFYLKHQNRALATELKSLQFAVQQLEAERDARRRHCREALHAVHELRNTWTSLEEETVGDISPSFAATGAEISSKEDPASTGSGDSVEWTRALQKSLVELGQGHSSEKSSISSTGALKDATANIAARAKVLQEWLGTLLKSGAGSALPRKNNNGETDDAEQRLHNLQHEMGVVTARCMELEAQVSELAAARKDIAVRERRIRRNVYRMAAGIMTSDHVINTLERGEGDELEAEVQLEKQSVKTEQPAESSSMGGASNQIQMDTVSSALLDEYKAKTAALEETASNAEKSIHDVRTFLPFLWSCLLSILCLQHLIRLFMTSLFDCS